MMLSGLKRFVARDFCWRCSASLAEPHAHVLANGQVECACADCAPSAQLVPHRFERLADSPISDATWSSLGLPIGLAFFVRESSGAVVGWYPGPAGATRCALPVDLPLELAPDVEALLVNRLNDPVAYRVSIDECFALIGQLRKVWRGFGGGEQVRDTISRFFERAHA